LPTVNIPGTGCPNCKRVEAIGHEAASALDPECHLKRSGEVNP